MNMYQKLCQVIYVSLDKTLLSPIKRLETEYMNGMVWCGVCLCVYISMYVYTLYLGHTQWCYSEFTPSL